MDRAFVSKRFGQTVDFGACFVGENLNVRVLRGFARLDQLAIVSAPDIYDQVENPTGTQRALSKQHARECADYAEGAADVVPEDEPRFFPEILLNVRELNAIDLYNIEDPEELYEFSSFSSEDQVPAQLIGVRANLSVIEFPKANKSPEISRVDGNHRLWGIDERISEEHAAEGAGPNGDGYAYPRVPFALLVGLKPMQEARLFRDINGEHKGMDVTHLAQIELRITSDEDLKRDPARLPLWIAGQLSQTGRAFEDMVFFGGEKGGLKRLGEQRPLKLNSLKSAIAEQLKGAPRVTRRFENDPDALLELVDRYWKAVRATFPEAWHNRRDFILLQAIGLGAFAMFGAETLTATFDRGEATQEDFDRYLATVAKVSLKRSDYEGIAGAGGGRFVADKLFDAAEPDALKAEKIRPQLRAPATIDERLGLDKPRGSHER